MKSAMADLFGDVFIVKVEEAKTLVVRAEEEVARYKSERCLTLDSNSLLWWKNNAIKYPLLSNVAKYYLCIHATSVPSERVFSTAGDIATAQRAALSGENVDILIFLKKNLIL